MILSKIKSTFETKRKRVHSILINVYLIIIQATPTSNYSSLFKSNDTHYFLLMLLPHSLTHKKIEILEVFRITNSKPRFHILWHMISLNNPISEYAQPLCRRNCLYLVMKLVKVLIQLRKAKDPCVWSFLFGIALTCLTGRSSELENAKLEVYIL